MKKQLCAFVCLSLFAIAGPYAAEVKVIDGLATDVQKKMKETQAQLTDNPGQVGNQEKPRTNRKEANPPKKTPDSGPDAFIAKLEFKQARIVDVIRALADMSGMNIVATNEAAQKDVTLFLQNITVKDALDTIVKNSGLWYREEKAGRTIRIMTTNEYQQDMVVYREDETRVFNLLHPNPVVVATAIRDLYGERVIFSQGIDDPTYGRNATSIISGTGQIGTNNNNNNNNANIGGGGATARNAARQAANVGTATSTVTGAATAGVSAGRVAEEAVIERLTPDQIAKVEGALKKSGDGQVSAELLREIIRTEQLIYITVNREHNLILVRTGDSLVMKEIERLIKEMDRPTPQVLLEMKVLELSVGDTFRQLFDFNSISNNSSRLQSLVTGNNAVPSEASTFIYRFLNDSISVKLELLQKNNQIKTLSSPVLMASNNRPARVFVGDEWVLIKGVSVTDPVLNPTTGVVQTPAKVTYELEDRDIGNTLTILPKINADKTVTLAIQHDASTVNLGGITLPPLSVGDDVATFKIDAVRTATIEGTVIAKDGLTVAIGGLITNSYSNDVRKVPILGDLPWVGELFKRKEETASKKELVLLITPHIITNPMEGVKATENQMDNLPLEVEDW